MKKNLGTLINTVCLVLGLTIILSSQNYAQLPQPSFTVESDFYSRLKMDNPPVPELNNNESEVTALNFRANLNYPFVFDQGNTILFLDLQYRQRYFHYHKWPTNLSTSINHLHEINFGMTLYKNIGKSWAVIVNATPQIASDLKGEKLVKEDFKFQGAVIFEKILSDKWTVGFGASYSSTFGQPLPIPLLTFRYESGNKWYAHGTLPSEVNLFYRLSSLADMGITAKIDGGMYHIPKTYPSEFAIEDPELQYVSAIIGPAFIFRYSLFELSLRGGLNYQQYGVYDGTDEIKGLEYKFKLSHAISAYIKINF